MSLTTWLISWNFHVIIFLNFVNLSIESHTQHLSIWGVWVFIFLIKTITYLMFIRLILFKGCLLHFEEFLSNHKVFVQVSNRRIIWLCLAKTSQLLFRKFYLLRFLTAKIIKIIFSIHPRVKNVMLHFRHPSLLNRLMSWLHLCLIKMLNKWISRWR